MQFASYLMFESGYTRELIALGYKDAQNKRDELKAFMHGESLGDPGGISGWQALWQEYTAKLPVLRGRGNGAGAEESPENDPSGEKQGAEAEEGKEPNYVGDGS